MTGYTTEEVARLLGLSPGQIRSYTRAAFLSPARAAGGRGELRFSFQDLVLLRAAKGLMAARIPAAKIRSSLRRLKQQLPRGRALSELRITAEGHRVVARDGALAWNPVAPRRRRRTSGRCWPTIPTTRPPGTTSASRWKTGGVRTTR